MKRNPTLKFHALATAALLLGAANMTVAQTTNFYVNPFSSGGDIADNQSTNCGVWYGSSQLFFDGSTPDTLAGPGDYSCYIAVNLNDSSGNIMEDYFTPQNTYDNLYYAGNPQGVQLSLYKAVHFDVLWDTVNSTIGIDQFDNVASINPGLASSDPNNSGTNFGLDVQVAGLGTAAPEPETLGYLNIPDAASNGWVTVTIPINPSESGIDGACGLMLKKWISTPGDIPANSDAFFWIGNVWFEGSAAPPPPPTLQLPQKPTPGLNVIASTPGVYDRQELALVASNGVSWVGNDLVNPVTYSFTINGFPQNPATQYACEAYLIMSPNPAAYDTALDYNEPDAILIYLQQGPGTTQMNFQYKINSPGTENYTTIGTVTNTGTALGTWSISFSSDTNVTMTAPNGNTSSFVFTNASSFAEVKSPGMYLYLGMQADNTASLNDAVCYSKFSITGAPAAVTDNFLSETTLNTNIWFTFMGTGPAGVFINPTNAAYWLKWNTPASGFHLQESSAIAGPWVAPSDDMVINGANAVLQLITTNDIPPGTPDAFFQLVKP